jgi:hypothetical protein
VIGITELAADLKRGPIPRVITYGDSNLPKALPCITIVRQDGAQGDTIDYQVWVCVQIGQNHLLDRYLLPTDEKPAIISLLLKDRKISGQRVWRWGNNYQSVTVVQENQQTFLRGGLIVSVPKLLSGMSADL